MTYKIEIKKKNKKKFKKKITIVVGFTSAALVALEYKNTVLHICPNPEIETYLSYFWNNIKVTKINEFSYIYNLSSNGKYLNFKQNDKIKLGICGEHGGDPESINFCSKIGLDYVSCSPYRVPIARLAAAQAELNNKDYYFLK